VKNTKARDRRAFADVYKESLVSLSTRCRLGLARKFYNANRIVNHIGQIQEPFAVVGRRSGFSGNGRSAAHQQFIRHDALSEGEKIVLNVEL